MGVATTLGVAVMTDWRTCVLDNGRVVECLAVQPVGQCDADGWAMDVILAIDGVEVGVHRVVVPPDDVRRVSGGAS